ncbi:hypothetical protein PLESTB_000215300 [Pleodorina starrii]|uniref:Uncharacterized protein n=1 Tax=Pleodorina starrii TaxID=330485 RepID=A0A9W6BD72_9CHLO|nr:hypothetical protein PLESTM_001540900 [Pleodorina starrii]GLC49401.1 hypothetical protein PLESTB_000215300 [Pleodorina starrii]GLC73337.1 hypothetical protein PLESTF_001364700 [Pleodorina starrii]
MSENEANTVANPIIVEAGSPTTTPERMMVLKPFVTSAYKSRVKVKGVGEDPWNTPGFVLQQAMNAHGRNMRELSELTDMNRRMRAGTSMVRLQADDYISQRADILLGDSDDSDVNSPSGSSAAGGSHPTTPREVPLLVLPRRSNAAADAAGSSARSTTAASAAAADAAAAASSRGDAAAAAAGEEAMEEAEGGEVEEQEIEWEEEDEEEDEEGMEDDGGGGGGGQYRHRHFHHYEQGGDGPPLLQTHVSTNEDDGSQPPQVLGSARAVAAAAVAAGAPTTLLMAGAAAAKWAKCVAAAGRQLPSVGGSDSVAGTPRAERGDRATPKKGTADRVHDMIAQLRALEREHDAEGDRSRPGSALRPGTGVRPGTAVRPESAAPASPDWTIRAPKQYYKSYGGGRHEPPPPQYPARQPMTPLLTDGFVQGCLYTDGPLAAALDAPRAVRFSSPGGGACEAAPSRAGTPGASACPLRGGASALDVGARVNSPCPLRGGASALDVGAPDGSHRPGTASADLRFKTFRARRPSLGDLPSTNQRSASPSSAARGGPPAPAVDLGIDAIILRQAALTSTPARDAPRIADRWMTGRRLVTAVNTLGGGAAAAAAAGGGGGGPAVTPSPPPAPPPPRAMLLPSRAVTPTPPPAPPRPPSTPKAGLTGFSGSARTLALVAAAAEKAGALGSPRGGAEADESEFGSASEGRFSSLFAAAGGGATLMSVPVVGATSRPATPANAAALFRQVTGTVAVARDGTAIFDSPESEQDPRPMRRRKSKAPKSKLQRQLQQHLQDNLEGQLNQAAQKDRVAAPGGAGRLVRRVSSSTNLELMMRRCSQVSFADSSSSTATGSGTKLPKLGAAFGADTAPSSPHRASTAHRLTPNARNTAAAGSWDDAPPLARRSANFGQLRPTSANFGGGRGRGNEAAAESLDDSESSEGEVEKVEGERQGLAWATGGDVSAPQSPRLLRPMPPSDDPSRRRLMSKMKNLFGVLGS